MPNGMANAKLTYRIIEGLPDQALLSDIIDVYKAVFDDYKLEFFKNRIHQKEDVAIAVCYDTTQLVGFKIGYRYNGNTFYSWVGGVLTTHRQQGIAQQLMSLQHTYAQRKSYLKIRTKSMNRFKPMMILNLKNGFDIVKVYTNDIGQTKVIFEKDLKRNLN